VTESHSLENPPSETGGEGDPSAAAPEAARPRRIIPPSVARYVSERLSPLLAQEGTAEIRVPEIGAKNDVFMVTFSSGRRVVLRTFEDRKGTRRYREMMRFCRGKDLPLPAIVACDDSAAAQGLFRCRCGVEEYAAGTPLRHCLPATDSQADAVLRALARLHGATLPRWGRMGNLRKSSFKEGLEASISRLVQEISLHTPGVSLGELGFWHGWFGVQIEEMRETSCFSPLHQRLTPDHIILPADGDAACFVSCDGLRFGSFAQDADQVLATLAPNNPLRRSALMERYLTFQTHLPRDADCEREFAVFHARRHLLRLRKLLAKKETQAGQAGVPESEIEEVRKTLRSLIQ
jgi:hypothetical protein